MILINLMFMHIVSIEKLMKGIMLWFTFILNAVINTQLKSYMHEPLNLTLFSIGLDPMLI